MDMVTSGNLSSVDESSYELGSYSLQLMWHLRQRAARAFEPLGFRTNRVLVLEYIAQGVNQPKDLHQALGIVPPAISTIIAELETRGLLSRQADPHDGRRVNLHLTPEGEKVRQQLSLAWQEVRREFHDSLSKKELTTTLQIYRKALGRPPH